MNRKKRPYNEARTENRSFDNLSSGVGRKFSMVGGEIFQRGRGARILKSKIFLSKKSLCKQFPFLQLNANGLLPHKTFLFECLINKKQGCGKLFRAGGGIEQKGHPGCQR